MRPVWPRGAAIRRPLRVTLAEYLREWLVSPRLQ